MRKVIVSNLISVDGFFAGPGGEIDWFVSIADNEFENYAVNLINSIDTMLFGRVTYELMASYWPNASSETEDPRIIEAMNNYPKIVFSTTIDKPEWNNTTLIKNNIEEEVRRMKNKPGKDMVIYGSGSIVSSFTRDKIIDEYYIFITPVILGKGKPLFNDMEKRFQLKLSDSKSFKSGLTVVHYVVS